MLQPRPEMPAIAPSRAASSGVERTAGMVTSCRHQRQRGFPMVRTILSAAAAVGLFLAAAPVQAKDEKAKDEAPAGQQFAGTIKGVSDDGKTLTVEQAVVGKKKKKTAPSVKEVKITDKTKVEYVDIDAKDDQKLQVGYAVTITLSDADRDIATAIKVSKAAD